jgi:hypothetical protein
MRREGRKEKGEVEKKRNKGEEKSSQSSTNDKGEEKEGECKEGTLWCFSSYLP